MKYKTKSDIPFLKFLSFSEGIEELKEDAEGLSNFIIEIFYNGNFKNKERKVVEFLKAIETNGRLKMRYKLNLELIDNASHFIDSENFQRDNEFKSLLELLVKPKYFFQRVDVNKISITEGEHILTAFLSGQVK